MSTLSCVLSDQLTKMSLKFAANLNFLFIEGTPSLLEKLQLARSAGFRGVEISFPGKETNVIDKLIEKKDDIGIEIVLMNIALGSSNECAFGATSIPGEEEQFQLHLEDSITVAKALKCKKIHVMSGKQQATKSYEEHLQTYIKNLKYAAKRFESADIVGVIEPINKYALPGYFMNSYDTAIYVLKEVNSPNLKLMVDIFHLQHIRGNITKTFTELQPSFIGHIQIAQVPHRHEPNVEGELDFSYLFRLIEQNGYNDWIGCEYKPKKSTVEGLDWFAKYGYTL